MGPAAPTSEQAQQIFQMQLLVPAAIAAAAVAPIPQQ